MLSKLKVKLYAIVKFLLDWRTALAFLIAWMITNGWGYLFIVFGTKLNIKWMTVVGTTYIAFLWLPFTPEKLITIPLTITIKKFLFKRRTNMETSNIKIVEQTFKEIREGVVPTMGAKGKLAVIQDEFSRPILTDDGVTVAKEYMNQSDVFKRMVATSMIEASANTEKTAFDGTTLTVLLTDEFFKWGLKQIRKGKHPQVVADKLTSLGEDVRNILKTKYAQPLTEEGIEKLGLLTTKIPLVGKLVAEAYSYAGEAMDIVIEHDRKEKEHKIEYTNGMILDAGYFSESLKTRCNEGDKAVYKDANIVILSEGMMTPIGIREFFESIPEDKFQTPFVFMIDKGFDPETMKIMMDVLVQNKMTFMFVFLNETHPEELFLDIAAKTGGMIQDASFGTSNYKFYNCGYAKEITIEQDKTTIVSDGNGEDIARRLAAYNKELKENEYTTGYNRANIITRRKANLNAGVTKIKLACPTVTEYMTIRLKLDDAIGAVKCALKHGVVPGGGKALWLIGTNHVTELKKPLQSASRTIIRNAGYKLPKRSVMNDSINGLDVRSGQVVNYKVAGIMDSFDSVDRAIQNALSIATQYLRTYILIKK